MGWGTGKDEQGVFFSFAESLWFPLFFHSFSHSLSHRFFKGTKQ
jgi:hypothetical protein